MSGLDHTVCTICFHWDVFNAFLGGLLGGTILPQVSSMM
jgi:hypothetical protein